MMWAIDNDEDGCTYGGYNKQDYSIDYEAEERSKALFTFFSEEALVTSDVFQKHLNIALAHKDRFIRELQEELIKYGRNDAIQ